MSIAGFITGIIIGILVIYSFTHNRGWLNWINIPVAILGFSLSIMGTMKWEDSSFGIAGIVINLIVIILGAVSLCRLFIPGVK